MASQLWLLRHGDAEPHGTRPDSERELTERGRRQSQVAGQALRGMEVRLDAVLCSPKTRALETAQLACEACGQGLSPDVHAPLAGGFGGGQARALLEARGAGAHVMLVGHEPDFSGIVHELTGARIELKKGGLVRIDMGGASGILALVMRPAELALIAAAVMPACPA